MRPSGSALAGEEAAGLTDEALGVRLGVDHGRTAGVMLVWFHRPDGGPWLLGKISAGSAPFLLSPGEGYGRQRAKQVPWNTTCWDGRF